MAGERRPVVAGNWKMNLDLSAGVELANKVNDAVTKAKRNVQVILFPSFPLLKSVGDVVRPNPMLGMGAQSVNQHDGGAHTGEVSGLILKSVGTSHVLIGHSERRQMYGETGDLVRRKFEATLRVGLRPLLCVGETAEERADGTADGIVLRQLEEALHPSDEINWDHLIIAYEPVWAIGTGVNATPDDAEQMHRVIREWISGQFSRESADQLRIVYGGSITPENAGELFERDGVDGGLVGGASLQFDSFDQIITAAHTR